MKFRKEIHVDVIWFLHRQRRQTVGDHVYLHSFLPVTINEGFWIVFNSGRFIPGERNLGIHSIEYLGESQDQAGSFGVKSLLPVWGPTPDHPPRGLLTIRTDLSRGPRRNEPCVMFTIIIVTHASNRYYSFVVC